jgi:hypothetical protein
MENKIIKTIVLILCLNISLAQNSKLDTLKLFEGHWVFKMAMNTDYTPQELEDTYLKDVRGNKIHIKGTRIYGDFDEGDYENFDLNLNKMPTNGGKFFLDAEFEEKDLNELKKLGIKQQPWIGFYQTPYEPVTLPYFSIQLLQQQQFLCVGMDQTMFLLERDKSEYQYISKKESIIFREDKTPTQNKILENEEVEIIQKGLEWTKIRYWGKALIIGWVKSNNLKDICSNSNFWNIYKSNKIKFKIESLKSIIYDSNFEKTKQYLIKGDEVEILGERGLFLKIKYKQIEGLIPRIDVESFNTFRITNSKSIIYAIPNNPTKMYLIKGNEVEILEQKDNWLRIRYYGKKTIEGWIKKEDVVVE